MGAVAECPPQHLLCHRKEPKHQCRRLWGWEGCPAPWKRAGPLHTHQIWEQRSILPPTQPYGCSAAQLLAPSEPPPAQEWPGKGRAQPTRCMKKAEAVCKGLPWLDPLPKHTDRSTVLRSSACPHGVEQMAELCGVSGHAARTLQAWPHVTKCQGTGQSLLAQPRQLVATLCRGCSRIWKPHGFQNTKRRNEPCFLHPCLQPDG